MAEAHKRAYRQPEYKTSYCPAFPILISNKHANFIFLVFSNTMKHTLYHLLTVNVRTRTDINIPHINFVTENSQDSVAL